MMHKTFKTSMKILGKNFSKSKLSNCFTKRLNKKSWQEIKIIDGKFERIPTKQEYYNKQIHYLFQVYIFK